jgi:hypothetical protein
MNARGQATRKFIRQKLPEVFAPAQLPSREANGALSFIPQIAKVTITCDNPSQSNYFHHLRIFCVLCSVGAVYSRVAVAPSVFIHLTSRCPT